MTGEQQDWDIVSGVGITALSVAAARAVDTSRADGLIRDPFAAAFVEAASPPRPIPTHADDIPADDHTWGPLSRLLALRSKFFDDYFFSATAAGLRQVVILAAGLDCRAFRLDWPSGTTVYEIDQPRVLEFKDQVLAGLGARPASARRLVPVDLRDDWVTALREAGFDSARPTAWLAEGLLPYLPDEAIMRLINAIHELSAPGSTVGIEHFDNAQAVFDDPKVAEGADDRGIDTGALFAGGSKKSPDEYLSSLGWQTTTESIFELSDRYARPLGGVESQLFGGRYITGTLGR
jgi:methyltransferase (TIGR00027 family)